MKKYMRYMCLCLLLLIFIGKLLPEYTLMSLNPNNEIYIIDSKNCRTLFFCSPEKAEIVLEDSEFCDGHFQYAKEDNNGNLVLILSQEDKEYWRKYIDDSIEIRKEASAESGIEFTVSENYKRIDVYTTRDLFGISGFNLTIYSTYCGIMQVLDGVESDEWYVDERMYDVETRVLIDEARFPQEGMSVDIEEWDAAIEKAEQNDEMSTE